MLRTYPLPEGLERSGPDAQITEVETLGTPRIPGFQLLWDFRELKQSRNSTTPGTTTVPEVENSRHSKSPKIPTTLGLHDSQNSNNPGTQKMPGLPEFWNLINLRTP
jgi:hypothetical protein